MEPTSIFNVDQFALATDSAIPATLFASFVPNQEFLTLTIRAAGNNADSIRVVTSNGDSLLLPEQSVEIPKADLSKWKFRAQSEGDRVVVSGVRLMRP